MQAHEKETGRGTEAVSRETVAGLEQGRDYEKKEGGLRVLTSAGVKRMAEALRLRRQATQQAITVEEPPDVPTPPEDAPEWRPGPAPEVAVEELDPQITVYATASRHWFNPKLLGCHVEGKAGTVNVRVRNSAFYRAGEKFAVKLNDAGEWEAEVHRLAPKFR
jgi:hypothetical protein